jgi:hypothetical protein
MAIRGKIFVAVLLALTLVALTPAFAGDKESMSDAWWTGPLQTPNAGTIPKNHWYVETYFVAEQDNGVYGNNGTKYGANSKQAHTLGMPGYDNNFQEETLMTYGVTNKFNLQILTDFGGVQGGTGVASTSGISADLLRIRLPYKLHSYKQGKPWPTFSIVPEVNIPVIASSHAVYEPGFGLWAIRPFWLPNGRILRPRISQDFFFPAYSRTVSNPSIGQGYNESTSCTLTSGPTCSFKRGYSAKTQFGVEYSLTKHWVPAFDFVLGYYGGQNKFGGAAERGITGVNAAGVVTSTGVLNSPRSYAVDPALEYNFTENTGIIFGVEVTVGGTNSGPFINHNNGAYIAPQIALQWFK